VTSSPSPERPRRSSTATPSPGTSPSSTARSRPCFDWELATIGDPLTDIGWTEVLWSTPNAFTALPRALSADEFVARWEERTGLSTRHRAWYRALASLKMAVILLVGGHLYEIRQSDDPRLLEMTDVIAPVTQQALRDLGVHEVLEPGPVSPLRRPS
jgi:hypothetical protein